MEARPPALIEAVVRTLVPPACREHIVGDLWERYRSPSQFVFEAARTVPFVIASQIRRTSAFGLVIIQAFVLFVGLGVGSGDLARPIAPIVAGLLGLVFRDAYRNGVSISARQIARDMGVGIGCVVLSQAIVAFVRPALLLPLPGAVGGAVAFGMIFLLRLQNPGLGTQARMAVAAAPASMDALLTEVRLYERLARRAARIEMVTGIALAGWFTMPLLSSPNWALRVGWGLAAAYGLYVAGFMILNPLRPMPDGLGYNASLAFYRGELERRHRLARTLWLWYLLPIVPAVVFIMIGAAMVAAGRGRPIWPAALLALAVAMVGTIAHVGARNLARKLRVRIDTLKAAEER